MNLELFCQLDATAVEHDALCLGGLYGCIALSTLILDRRAVRKRAANGNGKRPSAMDWCWLIALWAFGGWLLLSMLETVFTLTLAGLMIGGLVFAYRIFRWATTPRTKTKAIPDAPQVTA